MSTADRFHPDDLKAIIDALRVQTPWLSAKEAAQYLRCPVSRIYKLTMTGDLRCDKDGTRSLYHRDELDRFIRAGGATSV